MGRAWRMPESQAGGERLWPRGGLAAGGTCPCTRGGGGSSTRGCLRHEVGRGKVGVCPRTPGGVGGEGGLFSSTRLGLPLRCPGADDAGDWGQHGDRHHLHHVSRGGNRGCGCGQDLQGGVSYTQSPGQGGKPQGPPGRRGRLCHAFLVSYSILIT